MRVQKGGESSVLNRFRFFCTGRDDLISESFNGYEGGYLLTTDRNKVKKVRGRVRKFVKNRKISEVLFDP